jgi:hypothetical protein
MKTREKIKGIIRFIGIMLAFCIIGGAIGILIGMSDSPVINTTLVCLLGILASVVTVFFGLKKGGTTGTVSQLLKPIYLWYFCSLLWGVVIAGMAGLYIRNNAICIGTDYKEKTEQWYQLLKDTNNYRVYNYQIERYQNDTTNKAKYDSLINCKIMDSLQTIRSNELLKIAITKTLFEYHYGIELTVPSNNMMEIKPCSYSTSIVNANFGKGEAKKIEAEKRVGGNVGFLRGIRNDNNVSQKFKNARMQDTNP